MNSLLMKNSDKASEQQDEANLIYAYILNFAGDHDGAMPIIKDVMADLGITPKARIQRSLDRLQGNHKLSDALGGKRLQIIGARWSAPDPLGEDLSGYAFAMLKYIIKFKTENAGIAPPIISVMKALRLNSSSAYYLYHHELIEAGWLIPTHRADCIRVKNGVWFPPQIELHD